LGFPSPSALEVTGSHLRRVCLARLRCAFRLSQPPGAFFLPKPCRFFFTPAALVGFGPSEVSPPDSPGSPFGVPSPPGVFVNSPRIRRLFIACLHFRLSRVIRTARVLLLRFRRSAGQTRLQGFPRNRESVRPAAGVSRAAGADPLVGFQPFRVFSPPAMTRPLPRLLPCTSACGAFPRRSPVLRSFNEQADWLVSFETADPRELFVLFSVGL